VLKIKCPDGYTFEIKGDAKTIADMFKKHFRK
jgi:hypothetical protein